MLWDFQFRFQKCFVFPWFFSHLIIFSWKIAILFFFLWKHWANIILFLKQTSNLAWTLSKYALVCPGSLNSNVLKKLLVFREFSRIISSAQKSRYFVFYFLNSKMQPKLPAFAWLSAVCAFPIVFHDFLSPRAIGENRGESGNIEENGGDRAKRAKIGKNCGELWKTKAMSCHILQNGAIASYGRCSWASSHKHWFFFALQNDQRQGTSWKTNKNFQKQRGSQHDATNWVRIALLSFKTDKMPYCFVQSTTKTTIARLWLNIPHVLNKFSVQNNKNFGTLLTFFVRQFSWLFFRWGSFFWLFWCFWNNSHRFQLCRAHFHPVSTLFFGCACYSPQVFFIYCLYFLVCVLRTFCGEFV